VFVVSVRFDVLILSGGDTTDKNLACWFWKEVEAMDLYLPMVYFGGGVTPLFNMG